MIITHWICSQSFSTSPCSSQNSSANLSKSYISFFRNFLLLLFSYCISKSITHTQYLIYYTLPQVGSKFISGACNTFQLIILSPEYSFFFIIIIKRRETFFSFLPRASKIISSLSRRSPLYKLEVPFCFCVVLKLELLY